MRNTIPGSFAHSACRSFLFSAWVRSTNSKRYTVMWRHYNLLFYYLQKVKY
ncbi:hypothetical protein AH333_002566 [Salmonella enterica subsp. salamae]|nr:hypothetical protein [Salmonella enterica subsp. salamae]